MTVKRQHLVMLQQPPVKNTFLSDNPRENSFHEEKVMTPEYASATEQASHLKAMYSLAEELHAPFEKVKLAYEFEFGRLQSGAKLRDYLPVLTARRVRETLHRSV
jgi:Protein of unknown function (DUF3562)